MSGYESVVPEHPSVILHSNGCQPVAEIGFPEFREPLVGVTQLVPETLDVAVEIYQVIVLPIAVRMFQEELAGGMSSLDTTVNGFQAFVDYDIKPIMPRLLQRILEIHRHTCQ